jgi:protein-disulfide isomerase
MKSFLTWAMALVVIGGCTKGVSKPNFKFMPSNGKGIAVKAGDVSITESELNKGIETEIYEAKLKVFQIKFNRVKQIVIEKLMEKDPKKKGLTNDEYLEKYIASAGKVSKAQVAAFIKEKNIPAQHINPQIKERIKSFLMIEIKKKAVDKWLADRTKKSGITVYLDRPVRPSFDVKVGDAAILGNKDAKVTIVEFSDFQCPYCKKASETIHEVYKKYKGKVKIAFKNFPLPFHKNAKKAAQAALCAREQSADKFWKMHDKMFADQAKLAVADLKTSAKALGLNMTDFSKCLDSNKHQASLDQDTKDGKDVGVKSTPTFFVNGKLVSGAQPIEVFSEIIEEELNK